MTLTPALRPHAREFDREALRVVLYSGLIVERDAISNSAWYKFRILSDLAAAGLPVEVSAFCYASDYADPRIHTVQGVNDVLFSPAFLHANVHCFEFGIYYDLFDAVFLVPESAITIAIWHNITPPELAANEPERRILEWSVVQQTNLDRLQRIASDSEFNRDALVDFGLPPSRLSVLHLPSTLPIVDRPRHSRDKRPVRLLYVGRFVPAKGVIDLVSAVAALRRGGVDGFEVILAGNEALSDPSTIAELRAMIERERLQRHVRFAGGLTDVALAAQYAEADVLVMPSYHEGSCIPVIEALAAGCHVIAYDAGNLPNVVGRVGTLVPAGDAVALSAALGRFIDWHRAGQAPSVGLVYGSVEEWQRAVAEHLKAYSWEQYERGFLGLLNQALAARPGGAPPWLAALVARRPSTPMAVAGV